MSSSQAQGLCALQDRGLVHRYPSQSLTNRTGNILLSLGTRAHDCTTFRAIENWGPGAGSS